MSEKEIERERERAAEREREIRRIRVKEREEGDTEARGDGERERERAEAGHAASSNSTLVDHVVTSSTAGSKVGTKVANWCDTPPPVPSVPPLSVAILGAWPC